MSDRERALLIELGRTKKQLEKAERVLSQYASVSNWNAENHRYVTIPDRVYWVGDGNHGSSLAEQYFEGKVHAAN